MRVIIVDDEKPSISLLKVIMSKNKYLEIVGEYTVAKEALTGIMQIVPDVVFVDIEMPHMTGIELARAIMQFNCNIQIVFITAFEQYALNAFQVNAVNYILKPITEGTLDITVNRLLRNYNNIKRNNFQNGKTNRIITFGDFTVYGSINGERIQWATAKTKELFAYFVLERGKEIDKWKLCDVLYPESTFEKAEHNLHSTVSRMKASLRESGIENILQCKKGKYKMDLDSFSCDMWEWRNFIEGNPVVTVENISKYENIVDMYQGQFFGDVDFLWLIEEKEKIARYYLQSLKRIASYYREQKKYYLEEKHLRKYIEMEPYDEDVAELLMKTYFQLRNKLGIVNVYNSIKEILDKELKVTPKESIQKLYHELIMKL
jgi:two-component SAPR family response regulator